MHYPQTLKQLAEFFITFSTSEAEIEAQRIQLTQLEDFDSQLSFQRIDRQNLGYITVSDLLDFLRRYNAQLSDSEIFSFYEMFDSNADQRLSYTDFLEAILPTTNKNLRVDTAQRHSFSKSKAVLRQSDIDQALADFLQTEISFYHRINLIKRSLITSPDWDALEAFGKIDIERTGYIDRYCLLTFLKQYTKFTLGFDELLPLYRIIDTDSDGRLSYSEFQAIFIAKPLQQYRQLSEFSNPTETSELKVKNRDDSPSRYRSNRKPPSAYQTQVRLDSKEASYLPQPKNLNPSVGRQSNKSINDNLKLMVDNALKRSQETRARSAARARNRSFTSYQVDSSKDEISMYMPDRPSVKKSLKFEDETPTWNKSLNKSYFEARRNTPSETSFIEEFPTNASTYIENSRQDTRGPVEPYNSRNPGELYNSRNPVELQNSRSRMELQNSRSPAELKNSKAFTINPIKCNESSVEHNKSIPKDYYKDPPRERSAQRDSANKYETRLGRAPAAKYVLSSPDRERKMLVDSIVSQYSNMSRSRHEQPSLIQDEPLKFTEALYESKLYNERGNSPISRAETPLTTTADKYTSPLNESMSKYRTPNRSRLQTHERSLSREHPSYRISPKSPEKQSRFRTEDLECFAKALKEIAELDEQLDSIRKVLACHSDFSIAAAYQMLFPKLDYCTLQTFTDMLNNRGFHLDPENITLVFAQFDRDRDGNLSLKDFEHLIKSKDVDSIEAIAGRKSEYIHKTDTRNLVNQFVKMAVVFELSIENIREKLKHRPEFGLESALRAVDTRAVGYLTMEELKALAERNGVDLTRKDLRILMRRYDPNNIGKISLGLLADELTPKKIY